MKGSPDTEGKFVEVSRVMHLDNGVVAATGPDGRLFFSVAGVKYSLAVNVTDQRAYVGTFRNLGADFVGHENLHNENGYMHSRWYVFDPNANKPTKDLNFIWPGIARALDKKNDSLSKISKNIVFGVRAISLRLRDLSTAYQGQCLYATLNDVDYGRRFGNLDTFDVFLSIHSFLVEMGVLRDYLASFVAGHRYNRPNINKMSTLCRHLRKHGKPDASAKHLLDICDPDNAKGWLAQLSALRNMVVHSNPISATSEQWWMSVKEFKIGTQSLKSIYYGMPPTPKAAANDRTNALSLCVSLTREMLNLARRVASESHIVPEALHFTDSDLKRR